MRVERLWFLTRTCQDTIVTPLDPYEAILELGVMLLSGDLTEPLVDQQTSQLDPVLIRNIITNSAAIPVTHSMFVNLIYLSSLMKYRTCLFKTFLLYDRSNGPFSVD